MNIEEKLEFTHFLIAFLGVWNWCPTYSKLYARFSKENKFDHQPKKWVVHFFGTPITCLKLKSEWKWQIKSKVKSIQKPLFLFISGKGELIITSPNNFSDINVLAYLPADDCINIELWYPNFHHVPEFNCLRFEVSRITSFGALLYTYSVIMISSANQRRFPIDFWKYHQGFGCTKNTCTYMYVLYLKHLVTKYKIEK